MESYRYAYKVVILDSQLAEYRQSDIQDAPTELASLRADVDALSDELLNRYEEVTLLYDLSRELGVVLDVESASSTALVRTLEVIPARWGIVVVGSGTEASSRWQRQARTGQTAGMPQSRVLPPLSQFAGEPRSWCTPVV